MGKRIFSIFFYSCDLPWGHTPLKKNKGHKANGLYPLHLHKKIDCLTTTNLVNLKSNTMKNTLQKYGEFLFPTNFRKKICALFAFFNHSNAILADIIEY